MVCCGLGCAPFVVALFCTTLGVAYLASVSDELFELDAGRPLYDVRSVQAPSLVGAPLALFLRALETWPLSALLVAKIASDSELALPRMVARSAAMRALVPTFYPARPPSPEAELAALRAAGDPANTAEGFAAAAAPPAADAYDSDRFRYWTVDDYAFAYRSGAARPSEVARRVLDAARRDALRDVPLNAFARCEGEEVMRQALESDRRHAEGRPLSPLDGVPVAVKDEFDVRGYPTAGGMRFLRDAPPKEADAELVARWRDLGAVVVGKTAMSECGTSPLGDNPHYGHARNPFGAAHLAGGSSSGSAAVVGAGLVPLSLGADGGGSVRVPAAFCGAFGLKPTFGRLSERGALPLAATVAHAGPIAATARDLAIGYAAMAGADPRDVNTRVQPPPHVAGFARAGDLSDVRVGVYPEWVRRGAEPAMQAAFASLVDALRARGARVTEVAVPNLQAMMLSHKITILSEFASSLDGHVADGRLAEFSPVTRAALAMARSFRSVDYLAAAKVRTYALGFFDSLFRDVDVLLTPATGGPPPAVPEGSEAGFTNLTMVESAMRYVSVPNLTGHPAVVFPVAYTEQGLPLAAQVVGRHWDEHLLLRLAHAGEQILDAAGGRRTPETHFSPLDRAAMQAAARAAAGASAGDGGDGDLRV